MELSVIQLIQFKKSDPFIAINSQCWYILYYSYLFGLYEHFVQLQRATLIGRYGPSFPMRLSPKSVRSPPAPHVLEETSSQSIRVSMDFNSFCWCYYINIYYTYTYIYTWIYINIHLWFNLCNFKIPSPVRNYVLVVKYNTRFIIWYLKPCSFLSQRHYI
jgi:hypothetical protein